MPKLSIAQMAAELALKSKPKKIIQGAERKANLEKFLQGNHPKVPNVVYHATRETPKDQAINQFVGSKSGTLGSGVYTSPNTDYVSTYTGIPTPKVIEELKTSFPAMARPFVKAQEEGDFSGVPMGGYMMPLHPSLRNPLILEGSTPDPSYEALLKLGVPEHKIEGIVDKANERTGSIGKEIQSRAQKLGHDGVMYFKNGDLQEMVTYNPTQLKSATGNEGTFNPYDPQLNKASGGAIKKAIEQSAKQASKAPMIMKRVSKSIPELQSELREMKAKGQIVQSDKPTKPEFIKPNPKLSQNPAGYSREQWERNQTYKHDIRPTHTFSEPTIISPESIEGQPIVLHGGDRTIGGAEIHAVNNEQLTEPSKQYAGASFPHEKDDLGIDDYWASQYNQALALQNKALKAYEETGKMPIGLFTTMGPEVGNYSMHNLDVALKMLNNKNPSKAQKQAFKTIMQQGTKTYGSHPDFVGLDDPEALRAQLEANPDMRRLFIDRLETGKVYKPLDLPEGLAIRHAITEPELRDVPTGMSGFTAGIIDPTKELRPNISSTTYDTDVPGNYLGRMQLQLPWQKYFPKNAKQISENPKQKNNAFGTMQALRTYETLEPQTVDELMRMYEIIKGNSFKEGGQVQNFDKGGKADDVSVELMGDINYQPEPTYTDPMGMTVPSQDEMRLALTKQNMSPMPYSEPYRDPITGAIVENGLEALPSGFNEPKIGGMTPIDYENLPEEEKERTFGDRFAGALEAGTTLGTGMLAFPYAFGKGVMSGDFNKTFEDTMANNLYIPRDKGGIENLEILGKALDASKLPALMPELHGLEPIISSATRRGLQLGAKGVKATGKALGEHAYNKTEDFLKSQGLMPAITPEMKPSVTIEPFSPKDEFGFYSKLEKEAQNIQRKQGNGQAFKNDLLKLGVKPYELEQTGMDEFLKNNKSLTKDDVIGYAQRNRPEMKEQTLSKEMNLTFENEPNYYDDLVHAFGRDERLPRIYDSVNVKNNGAIIGQIFEEDSPYSNYYAYSPFADDYESFDTKEQAIKYLKENAQNYGEEGGQPLHANHFRTEGGSNYREMLVQLPEKDTRKGKLLDDMAKRLGAKNFESLPMEQRHEIARLANQSPFVQGHYSDFPNTMINMRMDDRVDVDGKKGTLLDELQSDWHQKGREKGYQPIGLDKTRMDLTDTLNALTREKNDLRKQRDALKNTFPRSPNISQENTELDNKISDIEKQQVKIRQELQNTSELAPDAPYKKDWYELGLKKAIQQSVERGDDRLYLSNGDTLADRYDLENHFSNIDITRNPQGFELVAKTHSGQNVTKYMPHLIDLEDHVGKDMAEKIKDDFANKSGNMHSYSGLDLRVGGEGMRKYYDEIYPSFLKKFAKKYGGTFGQTELPIEKKIEPEIDEFGLITTSAEDVEKKYKPTVKVYYYEPSPEAKKKIIGGLPYKKGGVVRMAEGGSMESDPRFPIQAHVRNFQSPDLLDIKDYGITARDNGDAFTLGRQLASKNAEHENPNMRFNTSQDYAQYATPMHRGMLNARVMKNPEQPSVQAMLQYMQEMGGGTAGIGLMGNRTSEGDKLRALQMIYNKQLSDTSDISGMLAFPFGDKPQFNVQYRKRFAEGGSVAETELAKMREIAEKAMIRRELSGGDRIRNEINSSKPTAEIKPVQPVNESLVNQEYNARRTKPTVALEPIGRGGSRIPSTQIELFKKKGGNVSIDEMQLALMRKR